MEQYSKFCQILTSSGSNSNVKEIQKILNSENEQLNQFIKSYLSKKEALKSTTAKSLYSKFSNEGYDKFANVLTNVVFFKYYFSRFKSSIKNVDINNENDILDSLNKMYYCLKDAFTDYTNLFLNTNIVSNLGGNNMILSFILDKLFLSAKLYDENTTFYNIKNLKLNLLEDCGKELNNLFSRSQKIENSTTIFVCCLNLIKVYFKLRTYRNCETLIGWVDRSEINFEKEIPLIYSCSYYYFTGRMNLYKNDIEKSKLCFEKSFNQMKNVNTKNLDNYSVDFHNKRLVLEYLIVLNLFYGKEPSKQLLVKYNLLEYSKLINAIKFGDIEMFDNETLLLEDRMAGLGTFLLVEKLKGFVVRNMINRTYNMMDVQNQQYPKLCLNLLYSIFSKYKYFDDYEEFEFYLISVLYKGLIKGYIHQEKKELVFSKKNPFPDYKSVLENNSMRIF